MDIRLEGMEEITKDIRMEGMEDTREEGISQDIRQLGTMYVER